MCRNTAAWALCVAALLFISTWAVADASQLPVITVNDNRTPAGELKNGVLNLRLELREARWYAEGGDGVYEDTYAFGEEGRAPHISGPLVRVPQGTRIHVSLHNLLPMAAKVYGLHTYPGNPDESIQVGPDETREAQFDAGEAGTYMYWATTSDAPLDDLARRIGKETTLVGAFVVDARGQAATDRIFVIDDWIVNDPSGASNEIFSINGKSWPATEHLTYKAGETVRWRIINAARITHAMHLHGFFFTVSGVGDRSHYTRYVESQGRKMVTERVEPGHTFDMVWTPDRAGNWLFHCHMTLHMSVSPVLHPPETKPAAHDAEHDQNAGMGGLVLGITVVPSAGMPSAPVEPGNARKLQLVISENPEKAPLYRLDLNDAAAPKKEDEKKEPAFMGPPIVLTRGEPVEIEVKNQSTSQTAIHWHGIELQSYYDGVPGWTGTGQQTTPAIAPGGSFVARMTPPRAGTFIYHTHWHDVSQLRNGLYGPLIVLEPGQKLDPETDHTFLFSVGIYPPLGFMMLINGQPGPDPLPLQIGKAYRFRLINITDDASDLHVRLERKGEAIPWKIVARDGAELPPAQIISSPADIFLPVGSTVDVEVTLDRLGLVGMQISSDILEDIAMQAILGVEK